mmetsp:Transcript_20305/g.29795  ORF Transcript_20305/g.29795 Transcript_20305/m.29795 type:complete len:489 (+) Transcript_20305:32-1498(+)|eukprot:CAMPEP_0195520170 /NCGR_PEP_ID=MMETSP0794_2-20130614/16318_1 /TAXON_ID=515487 /ORGANISM="Stephanopyxis turris, Strain CCMP 815" /LENGTH=488 /DNA_ID=CAMNT_0040649467 /DNA_START=29 /DNA_END=1495 /DNA_ORIENTATION=+
MSNLVDKTTTTTTDADATILLNENNIGFPVTNTTMEEAAKQPKSHRNNNIAHKLVSMHPTNNLADAICKPPLQQSTQRQQELDELRRERIAFTNNNQVLEKERKEQARNAILSSEALKGKTSVPNAAAGTSPKTIIDVQLLDPFPFDPSISSNCHEENCDDPQNKASSHNYQKLKEIATLNDSDVNTNHTDHIEINNHPTNKSMNAASTDRSNRTATQDVPQRDLIFMSDDNIADEDDTAPKTANYSKSSNDLFSKDTTIPVTTTSSTTIREQNIGINIITPSHDDADDDNDTDASYDEGSYITNTPYLEQNQGKSNSTPIHEIDKHTKVYITMEENIGIHTIPPTTTVLGDANIDQHLNTFTMPQKFHNKIEQSTPILTEVAKKIEFSYTNESHAEIEVSVAEELSSAASFCSFSNEYYCSSHSSIYSLEEEEDDEDDDHADAYSNHRQQSLPIHLTESATTVVFEWGRVLKEAIVVDYLFCGRAGM